MSKKPLPKQIKVGPIIFKPEEGLKSAFFEGHHKHGQVSVSEIIDLIEDGYTNAEIFSEFPGGNISWSDIEVSRALHARFKPESLKDTFARVSRKNVVMLDENMPLRMLPLVVKLYGRSSHVNFDGLVYSRNDDEKDIWAHMLENDYKVIFTRDEDFTGISTRHRLRMIAEHGSIEACPDTTPVVVILPKEGLKRELIQLISEHREDILRYIRENDAAYAILDEHGMEKHEYDPSQSAATEWLARLSSLRTGRSPGPS